MSVHKMFTDKQFLILCCLGLIANYLFLVNILKAPFSYSLGYALRLIWIYLSPTFLLIISHYFSDIKTLFGKLSPLLILSFFGYTMRELSFVVYVSLFFATFYLAQTKFQFIHSFYIANIMVNSCQITWEYPMNLIYVIKFGMNPSIPLYLAIANQLYFLLPFIHIIALTIRFKIYSRWLLLGFLITTSMSIIRGLYVSARILPHIPYLHQSLRPAWALLYLFIIWQITKKVERKVKQK